MRNKLPLLILLALTSCSTHPEFISEDNRAELIKNVIDKETPEFKNCYFNYRRENFDEGVVQLNFIIEENGSIESSNTRILSGELNKEIIKCLDDLVLSLYFPKSTIGKIEIRQPINFYPKKN